MQAPTLHTDRLILRPLGMDDWEPYVAAWADPELTRFIGGAPRDRQTSWGKFLHGIALWTLFGYGYLSFIERDSGRFIGNGGIGRFERGFAELEGFPEAGWAFIPAAWGRGYATEAMSAILAWADANLDDPEIRCIVDFDNIASRAVAAKLGFSAIGEVDDPTGRTLVYQRARRDIPPNL